MAFRTHLNVHLQAELLGQVINDGQMVVVPGTSAWDDTTVKFYYYDVNSSATDDGENVIKPTSVLGDGRYIKLNRTQWQADWSQSNSSLLDFIKNKPSFATIATTGAYSDLTGKPSLSTVATSGSYTDLSSKPSIPSAQIQSDWTQASSGSLDFIKNKPTLKKQETFSGTTNASGNYTVTFGASYSVAPNIQANIIGGSNTNLIKITSVSTTGFTVNVVNRTDVVGLLPSYANVNGASVDVICTEK